MDIVTGFRQYFFSRHLTILVTVLQISVIFTYNTWAMNYAKILELWKNFRPEDMAKFMKI